jgi:hypothetical protein
MSKNSFLLSNDHKEIFDALPPEKAGALIRAVFAYEIGEIPDLSDDLKIAFIPIRQWLDRNRESYENVCKERSEAGKKGGRPKKQKDSEENKKSNCFLEKAKKADHDLDHESDLEEQDTSTTDAGAREDSHVDNVDNVESEERDVIVRKYAERFNAPTENERQALKDFKDLYGIEQTYNAVCITGKRSPPPAEPIAYIKAVIADNIASGGG